MNRYSPNQEINRTISALLAIGCPPIPVAPKQDCRNDGCHPVERVERKFKPDKQDTVFCDDDRVPVEGNYCKISFTACNGDKAPIKGDFVRIDVNQNPTGLFTGKNPSYLDSAGRPRKLLHGEFQKRLPTESELKKFFCNPATGIGTLGGHAGVDWLDFDAKNYPSQEACDADVTGIIERGNLQNSWIERTGSNGWRIAVKPKGKPTFTNFATSPDGQHVGEALFEGRYTVLAPSVHPNGNPYRRISWGNPIEVESLQSVGIYPSKDEVEQAERKITREAKKNVNPNYDKPTDPNQNPWDIRNFAPYFDGYSEQGDWGHAQCPHHNGTSLTSFRVSISTGATKLWCGCSPKDVYNSGLALAKSRGYKLPDKNNDFCVSSEKQAYYCFHCQEGGNAINFLRKIGKQSFTDTILKLAGKHQITVNWDTDNPKYIARETIELVKSKTDIVDTISEHLSLTQQGKDFQGVCPFHKSGATPFESISNLFKDFKHKLNNSFKGFGEQRVKPTPKPKPEEVKINIPTPNEYQKLGHPHIIYDGDILNTWQQAKTLGYKAVLDQSSTGMGKSYAAGDAIPESFNVDKIFYLAADHRNPTTERIETNFGDIPPRNNGFKLDESRLTPLGNPYKVWAKDGEKPDTSGNCFRTNLFHGLAAKNLHGIEQSNESPICGTCHLAGACQSSTGDGYGFRFERRQAFASDRLRAHPDSMPNTEDGEYSKWMGIWDEVSRLIKPMKLLEVKLADFDKAWAELEAELPEHHQKLTDLRRLLRQFLTGELKQPYHGWGDAEIRTALPQPFDDVLLLADEIEKALTPDLTEVLETPDNVDFRGNAGKNVSKATRDFIRQTLRKEAYTESSQNLNSVLLNWLPELLRVWGGEHGAMRCQWATLTVASRDEKHADIVKAFSFNVFLDATVDPDILALRLGIPRHELLVIEKSKPSYQNLRIIQVNGFGNLGKNRSDSIKQRVELFQAWLRQKHSDIDFIDWLAFSDFAHFREGRGSNQFIDHSALASFGTPYQNIGSLQMEWQTLTGNSPEGEEFQAFVDAHVQEEIIQEVGRLRSHLAPEQQKTFYFVADYDINFLADELPGVTIESVDVVKLCPEAAGGANQTKWAILQAYKQLSESAAKITTTTVGAAAGVTQGCVSKIAQDFGGWRELEKLLRVLLSKLYSVGNNSDEPEFDIKYMADEYLPLALDEPEVDALAEVKIVAESFCKQGFEKIIELMPLKYKAKLLAVILNLLPEDVGDELKGAIADLQMMEATP